MALEVVKTGTLDDYPVKSIIYTAAKGVLYSELHGLEQSKTTIYAPDETPVFVVRINVNDTKCGFEISIDRSVPDFAKYLRDFRFTMITELQMLSIIYPEKKLIKIDGRPYVKVDNIEEALNIECLFHVYGNSITEFPALIGIEEMEEYHAGEFNHKSIECSIKDLEEKIAILKSI